MPSSQFRIESFKRFTDDGLILLLTITHEDLTSPIRLAWYDDYVTSRGNTFAPLPTMSIDLPNSGDPNPTVKMTLYGPVFDIVPTLRNIDESPIITLEIVRIKDTDTVEEAFENLMLSNITIDENITGDLVTADDLERSFPKDGIYPSNFPGVFP